MSVQVGQVSHCQNCQIVSVDSSEDSPIRIEYVDDEEYSIVVMMDDDDQYYEVATTMQ